MSIAELKKKLDKRFKDEDKTYVTFDELAPIPRHTTGSLVLDRVFGGGLPLGRILNFFGPESSGKSTLSTFICSTLQKAGLNSLYIDAENSFDPLHANELGYDVTAKDVLFSQEENGNIIYAMIEEAAQAGIKIAVIDSSDSMMTAAEENAEFGDAMMGQKARMNSFGLAKLKGLLKRTETTLIIVSQTRQIIGTTSNNKEGVSGGNAFKFYSSIRARVSRVELLFDPEDKNGPPIGQKIRVKIWKNKVGTPGMECELSFLFKGGFQPASEIIDMAADYGLIERVPGWYTIEGEKINGMKKVLEWLKDKPEVETKLKEQVLYLLQSKKPLVKDEDDEEISEDADEEEIEVHEKKKAEKKKERKKRKAK